MRKIIPIFLFTVLLLGSSIQAFAAETTGADIGNTQSGTIDVDADYQEEWSFSIPADITLTAVDENYDEDGKQSCTADFSVVVKGNPTSNHYITIDMSDLVLNYADTSVKADFNYDSLVWYREDCIANNMNGTSKNCEVSVKLTPGTYTGKITYNAQLVKTRKPGLYDETGTMVTSWDDLVRNQKIKVENGVLSHCKMATADTISGSLVVDNTVTSIGDGGFQNTSIAEIILPDCVTSLGQGAFMGCSKLKNITFSSNLESIGMSAFSGTALETVILPNSVTTIGSGVFSGCSNLKTATLSKGMTTIPQTLFAGSMKLESVTIPDTITEIGMNAFAGCSNLELDIPDSVTAIGEFAFSGVKHITYTGPATGSPWGATSIN